MRFCLLACSSAVSGIAPRPAATRQLSSIRLFCNDVRLPHPEIHGVEHCGFVTESEPTWRSLSDAMFRGHTLKVPFSFQLQGWIFASAARLKGHHWTGRSLDAATNVIVCTHARVFVQMCAMPCELKQV